MPEVAASGTSLTSGLFSEMWSLSEKSFVSLLICGWSNDILLARLLGGSKRCRVCFSLPAKIGLYISNSGRFPHRGLRSPYILSRRFGFLVGGVILVVVQLSS